MEQREEVLRLALVTASPGSFSASPATSLPLLKKKRKRLAVTKEISGGRRGQWERFRNA